MWLFIIGCNQTIRKITYVDYSMSIPGENLIITDVYDKEYKYHEHSNSNDYYINSSDTILKIDTTILIGFDNKSDVNSSYKKFYSYYSKNIHSPPHSGDPNFAIVSFLIGYENKVKDIRILKDVNNRFCGGEWSIKIDDSYSFYTYGINYTEYIVKVVDISYCTPVLDKKTKIFKKD